jgi:hypothetical protein
MALLLPTALDPVPYPPHGPHPHSGECLSTSGWYCGAGMSSASGSPCPVGYFSSTSNAQACSLCVAGKYALGNASVCLNQTTSPEERQGLVSFRTNTFGWRDVSGWADYASPSSDPCWPTAWPGVACFYNVSRPYISVTCVQLFPHESHLFVSHLHTPPPTHTLPTHWLSAALSSHQLLCDCWCAHTSLWSHAHRIVPYTHIPVCPGHCRCPY